MNIFPPQDETHPFRHLNCLEASQSMLASALETTSSCEIGPQLKLPSVGAKEMIPFLRLLIFFFHWLREPCQE